MKLAKVGKKNNKSLYGSFLWMTLLPMSIAGLLMILVCSRSVKEGIRTETENNLRNVATSVLAAYDMAYEGDYNVTIHGSRTTLWKGDTPLNPDYSFIDSIAAKSDVQISIFFYDTRLLTTICDSAGERAISTGLNSTIFDEVYNQGRECFYDNIRIENVDYFAYYAPIYSQDSGVCLGVIGVAKPSAIVNKAVNKGVWLNLGVIVLAMLVTSVFILRYASQIVSVIKKMMDFLGSLADNNLNTVLDEGVSHRGDELGSMGRSMIRLQSAIKKLIERDVLTGLYNRRSAEKKIDEIENGCRTYCVAIGDIDFFKKFNDSFGHECGDVVLKEVARLLNENMTNHGFVARWGGEEFLLVFENEDIDTAYVALLGVRDALHKHEVEYDGQFHKVTMTFGVEEKQPEVPINKLIRAADDKLYEGKQAGRDRVCR